MSSKKQSDFIMTLVGMLMSFAGLSGKKPHLFLEKASMFAHTLMKHAPA